MSVTILPGDCRHVLTLFPDNCVDCVVTSPPYWGLRDYGVDGQMGLEKSLGEHMAGMVAVFAQVRRVLKPTGTVWLNYGDAYASTPNGRSAADTKAAGNDDRTFRDKPISTVGPIYDTSVPNVLQSKHQGGSPPPGRIRAGGYLKPKDRMLLPARLAIALQEDGWWVRDEIIWHKPNPMPSSVKDRTTPAHEMIYMLSKAERYFYDHGAIKEPAVGSTHHDLTGQGYAAPGQSSQKGNRKTFRGGGIYTGGQSFDNDAEVEGDSHGNEPNKSGLRAKRSVWTVPPKGFKEAHFATFPPDLIRPCILAGCPLGGVVLDPFFGAGTVGLVAMETGRRCIGIELNPSYIEIAKRRLGLDMAEAAE